MVAILVIAVLIFFSWDAIRMLRRRRKRRSFEKSTEGQIQSKLLDINEQMLLNEEEMSGIQSSISDLKEKRPEVDSLSTANQKAWKDLMQGFQSELELRQTKKSFFETCIEKLKTLLNNHRVAGELEEKRRKLESLKENHYEDLAKLEEMSYDVEADILYLDTLDKLSRRLLDSSSTKEAEILKQELDDMTRNIKKL